MLLKEVRARKIPDSRGDPTIEVEINGVKASSPSGKSKGVHETPSFHKSLAWNINFLNKTKFNISINSFDDLRKVESLIGKKTKLKDAKQFGANALFALECAILKALAKEKNIALFQVLNKKPRKIPIPVGNAVGGGLHSHNKDHPTFQEFLLIPQGKTAKQNVSIMQSIHAKLKAKVHASKKNDEGAWQTSLGDETILSVLSKFKKVRTGIDAAASAFHKNKEYTYKNKTLDKQTQIKYVNALIKNYNILYCEDPLQEEDFQGFSKVHRDSNHLVVGDDLTATQISRLKKAIKTKAINAMIIKPNQNGSLVELKKIFDICKKNKIKTILSHRSGETMDNALADLAVGFQTDYIKAGISTKWREAKLKRLVEIEKIIPKQLSELLKFTPSY
jgi:enolase